MPNSEKFKAAFEVIMDELRAATKNEHIKSVKFVLEQDQEDHGLRDADKKSPETMDILGGICRWDPVRKKIVCGRP